MTRIRKGGIPGSRAEQHYTMRQIAGDCIIALHLSFFLRLKLRIGKVAAGEMKLELESKTVYTKEANHV